MPHHRTVSNYPILCFYWLYHDSQVVTGGRDSVWAKLAWVVVILPPFPTAKQCFFVVEIGRRMVVAAASPYIIKTKFSILSWVFVVPFLFPISTTQVL